MIHFTEEPADNGNAAFGTLERQVNIKIIFLYINISQIKDNSLISGLFKAIQRHKLSLNDIYQMHQNTAVTQEPA